MSNPLNELRLKDLRLLEKALETRRAVLYGLLVKDSRERVVIIATLPDGFSVDDNDKIINGDIAETEKVLQYIRLLIREKRPY